MGEAHIFFDEGPLGTGTWFRLPDQVIIAWTPAEVPSAMSAIKSTQTAGKWIAGYAAYELGYVLEPKLAPLMPQDRDTPLLCFGVFDGPEVGDLAPPGGGLNKPLPIWDMARYQAAFDRVKSYIGAGDCYQINLTFPMQADWSGDPLALYAELAKRQPVRHGAFVDLGVGPVLLSRSPELFFRTADGMIETLPMKGTIARGLTHEEDEARVKWLAADEKNRAENLMIVDLLRNDISRIAEPASVEVPELFRVETYATVHQMVSRVRAHLGDVDLPHIFRALFPCGSITGAPKLRAMEIIRELEPEPRGAYCGAIGWAGPDGRSSFNVAIRTISLFDGGRARLNVGGGVVWDSTAPSEYEEALWKARYADLT